MTAPEIGGVRLVTAHDVCAAAEAVLVEHLPAWAEAAGLEPVRSWTQLPTVDSLTSAVTPVGAITSPGLTAPPVKHRDTYEATWRLTAAVYDRAGDHTDTQRKVRTWAALIRAVLVQHPRLSGISTRLVWVGEDYALLPAAGAARTLGGCAVAFDVTVRDVVPADAPPELGGSELAPNVLSTRSTVTVRPPLTQE